MNLHSCSFCARPPRDEDPGAPPVVVLPHETGQSIFGGDPSVVGRVVTIDRTLHHVIGAKPDLLLFEGRRSGQASV